MGDMYNNTLLYFDEKGIKLDKSQMNKLYNVTKDITNDPSSVTENTYLKYLSIVRDKENVS